MNDLERALKFKEKLLLFYDIGLHPDILDDDWFFNERKYFINTYNDKAPNFLKHTRSILDLVDKLRNVASWSWSYQMRRDFINNQFEDFLTYLEFWVCEDKIEEKNESWQIVLCLDEELYDYIKWLLAEKNYYHAVEESYKFVREKLRQLTWCEQWHKAFADDNYDKIFWYVPEKWTPEWNFIEWIKYLNYAIQSFRNENIHSLCKNIDENDAMHFISLSSLAYKLISKKLKYLETNYIKN